MFNFILKTFKHTDSFVDVGGIFLWTASFSRLSLLTLAERGNCLRRCVPGVLGRWGAVEVAAVLAPREKLSQISEQVCAKRPKREKLLQQL